MAWPLTTQEKDSFIQFLEPNPPVNNHGLIKIRHFSFYSSELKSLGQDLRTLVAIQNGKYQSNAKTDVRYRNTLYNMGLISENKSAFVPSILGINILEYCLQNNIIINTFNDATNRVDAFEIEKYILVGLINELIKGDLNLICTDTFKQILFNAQEVYNSIPQQELTNILNNDAKIYFLQLINSTGDEVKRYFRLSAQDQTAFEQLWKNCAEDDSFPSEAPASVIDSMVYKYCRTKANNTLQYDIRFRVQAFLKAYHHCVFLFADKMPILNKDLKNINDHNNNIMNIRESKNFDLGPNNPPVTTLKPRHRIISGCPGSGKSLFIETEASSLPNSFLVKTTFHQETTYYDFVGTYKPTPLYEKNDNIINSAGVKFELGKPVINYSFVFGHLIESYLLAIKNPNWNIILIIDEINRGNVGVIFGDFFQLLDRDNQNQFTSKYPILPNADLIEFLSSFDFMRPILSASKNHIKFPGNLFIWGTMNSADQGVFPIDSAFRRRWEFEYKGYNEVCIYGADLLKYNNTNVSWEIFRNKINQKLLTDLNTPEDKLIGPYFLTQDEISKPEKILNKLFLYLWDDVARFQQKELMNYDSFADLKTAWNNGQGKIFTFDII
jgi:5-methylcytosine-specific restriction protein B